MAPAHLLFSVWTYGALTSATVAMASWRSRPALTALAWALAVSFVASRLLSPALQLNTLALAHAGLHLALLSLLVFVLGAAPTWPVLGLALLTLVQFALNLSTVLLFDPYEVGPRHEYDAAVAALFSLQLACVWAERLRPARRPPAPRPAAA